MLAMLGGGLRRVIANHCAELARFVISWCPAFGAWPGEPSVNCGDFRHVGKPRPNKK
jgi:hypothetical protein